MTKGQVLFEAARHPNWPTWAETEELVRETWEVRAVGGDEAVRELTDARRLWAAKRGTSGSWEELSDLAKLSWVLEARRVREPAAETPRRHDYTVAQVKAGYERWLKSWGGRPEKEVPPGSRWSELGIECREVWIVAALRDQLERPASLYGASPAMTAIEGVTSVKAATVSMMAAGEAPRRFETGASRDTDLGKLDYDGFISPLVLEAYARYMDANRQMLDGSTRASDNWQRGIPKDVYMKSAWRHFIGWWSWTRGELRPRREPVTDICGLLFNAMGYLHELLKEDPEAINQAMRTYAVWRKEDLTARAKAAAPGATTS